jgi:hypothetical protein
VPNCSDGTSNASYEDLVDAADCTFASATKIGNVVTPTTTGAFALKTGKVKKGKYRVSFGGSLYAEQITQCGFRLFDGTNIVGPVIVQNGHAATYTTAIDGYSEIVEYTSDQASVEWKLQAIDTAASANSCVAAASTANGGSAVSISMEPATSEMIAALSEKMTVPNISKPKTCYYAFGGAAATLASPTVCSVGTCVEVVDTCAAGTPPAFASTGIYTNVTFAAGTFSNSSYVHCDCTSYPSADNASGECNLYRDTGDQSWSSDSSGGYVFNVDSATDAGTQQNSYVSISCEGQAP